MRLTTPLKIIIRRSGQPEWYEIRNPYLPRGHKIFDYSPKYYGSFIVLSGIGCYVMAQAELHPDSHYARVWNFFNYLTDNVSNTFTNATGIGEEEGTNSAASKGK